MTHPRTFILHSDPGHGWLQVHIHDLAPLGLSVSSFTKYSYTCEEYLFLEEDEDAGRFIRAYVAKHGEEPIVVNRYTPGQSEVRIYNRLRAA